MTKQSKHFPPQIETPRGWKKAGKRAKEVVTKWGKFVLPVQRYQTDKGDYVSLGLSDESGLSPWVLARCVDIGSRLPYEETSDVLAGFRLNLGRTKVNTICHQYNLSCQTLVEQKVEGLALDYLAVESTLSEPSSGKTWVLEVDGVIILKKPIDGNCEGLEVKDAVLYPLNAPSQRYMLSSVCHSDLFTNCLSGLLRWCWCQT